MFELFLSKWVIDNFHSKSAGATWKVWQLQREFAGATWSEAWVWWKERERAREKTVFQAPWFVAKMAFKPEYQYLDKFSFLKFLINTMLYTILWLTIFMDCHYKKWRNSKKDVTYNPALYRKFALLLFFVEWMLSHLIDRIKKQKRLELKVKTEFWLLNVTYIIFFKM
jgi:hypothetical protein